MSLQFKKHIKRTQDRPGGIVDIEVNCHVVNCTDICWRQSSASQQIAETYCI